MSIQARALIEWVNLTYPAQPPATPEPCCDNPNPHTHTHPSDPAYDLLTDDFTSTPEPGVFDEHCYICTDPEFAQMGLPLCRPCPICQLTGIPGHVPADDSLCTLCGADEYAWRAEHDQPTAEELANPATVMPDLGDFPTFN
jgi:hypothetical protein